MKDIISVSVTIFSILVVLALVGVLLILRQSETGVGNAKLSCFIDDDCVPATCCHPSKAVNKLYAPNCEGVICTAVCEPGTIDCGQGRVACVNNKCTVILYGES